MCYNKKRKNILVKFEKNLKKFEKNIKVFLKLLVKKINKIYNQNNK